MDPRSEGTRPAAGPVLAEASLPQSGAKNIGTTFDPEAYAALNAYVQKRGWERVLSSVATIPADARILDLGFGHGGNTAELARSVQGNGGVVFGIEASEAMVDTARRNYPAATHPNLKFLNGRAEEAADAVRAYCTLNGTSQPSFDIVLSNYTLHWVRDPSTPSHFLHEDMFRTLNTLQRLGDRQFHFCAERDAFMELFEAGYSLIRESNDWRECFPLQAGDHSAEGEWRHPPLISSAALSKALERSGYDATIEKYEDERRFDSRASLEGWVGAMIRPFMSRIPEGSKESFVNAWVDRYLSSYPWAVQRTQAGEDAFILRDRNLLVVASKVSELD